MGQTLKFGCGGLVALFILLAIISALSGGSKSTATNASTPVPTSTAINLAAAKSPLVQATATPIPATATPAVFVVANTGGEGVYIRRTPDVADRIKVWPDNTQLLKIGDDLNVDGKTWTTVRDPDGNEGWVPKEYLGMPTPTPAPTPTIDRSRYKLELLASNGTSQYGFATVEGQVKNISGSSLKSVMVVVEWATADGQFVKSDDSLVEYDPILAGQVSPFKSITSHNPAMQKYRISFKQLFGGTISTLDSRKR